MYAQLCLTLWDLRDCSLPVSSVLGILQARILEWVAIPFSRGSSQPRDWARISCISCTGRQILYHHAAENEKALSGLWPRGVEEGRVGLGLSFWESGHEVSLLWCQLRPRGDPGLASPPSGNEPLLSLPTWWYQRRPSRVSAGTEGLNKIQNLIAKYPNFSWKLLIHPKN